MTNLATAKSQWRTQAGFIPPRSQGMERSGDWPRREDGAGTYQGHRGVAAWPCLGQPGRSLWAAGELHLISCVSEHLPAATRLLRSCSHDLCSPPHTLSWLLPSIGNYHKTSTVPSAPM